MATRRASTTSSADTMNPQAPRPRVFTNRRRFLEHSVVGQHEAIETHFTEFIVSVELKLECGPMPNEMVALPNIGGALCSTPQSLADAHY